MNAIKSFKDIPQFTKAGGWQCDFDVESLKVFIEKEINEEGLQLNPSFQRGHVWTEQQQIAFLEYFFRGGKSGTVVYLNKPDWQNSVLEGAYNDFVCVDGLQRLTAILNFVDNKLPIFGMYRNDFEDGPRMMHSIKVNINDLKTEKEVLQWYVDMNAGGTPHTTEEIDKVKKMINNLE